MLPEKLSIFEEKNEYNLAENTAFFAKSIFSSSGDTKGSLFLAIEQGAGTIAKHNYVLRANRQ